MKRITYLILSCFLFISLTNCSSDTNKKTTIFIKDNHRHYYPILVGQSLDIVFSIKNTGDNLFILSDIFTSCGCVNIKEKTSINRIPPGKTRHLVLTYDSSKNMGYVKQYITLYGNFENSEKEEITFDLNVVPDALYIKDYEELYKEKHGGLLKEFNEGGENHKGYYTDDDL